MCGYKSFIDNDPVGVLWSLNQQVGQMWNGDIWFVGTMH